MIETQPTTGEFSCPEFPDNCHCTVRSRFNAKNIDAEKLVAEVDQ